MRLLLPVSKLSTDHDRWMLLMLRQVALPIHFLHSSVCSVCCTVQTAQLSKGCGDMAQRHVWVHNATNHLGIELAGNTACHGPSMLRTLHTFSPWVHCPFQSERVLTKTTLFMEFALQKPKR
ncbi:hypothetical protein CaCOL14_005715 [Colletotrichum acutatum]